MKSFYISYRNQGKPERTPILGNTQELAQKNIKLLKMQGATSVRIHWVSERGVENS